MLVYIDHTTGGVPIEDWAVKAFERWRVGRKGIDDGLVLFVFSDDHRVRIEVGYGLEPVMPDTRASAHHPGGDRSAHPGRRPGRRRARRRRRDHRDAGRRRPPGAAGRRRDETPAQKISFGRLLVGLMGLGLVLVLLLGFAVTHPGLAWLLTTMIGSGRGAAAGAAAAAAGAGAAAGVAFRAAAAARAAAARRGRGDGAAMKGIDSARVEAAIRAAEARTSGELRVAVARFFLGHDVRRAAEKTFQRLGIHRTKRRNGVLIFVAPLRPALRRDRRRRRARRRRSRRSGATSSTACSIDSAPAT